MKLFRQNSACLSLSSLLVVGLVCASCKPAAHTSATSSSTSQEGTELSVAPDPLAIILAEHQGDTQADKEIRKYQDQVRRGINRQAAVERLGWAYVAKAHESFDPGFYKLAEICATVLESDSPGCAEGLLLRGHVLQNLHRFKEAESIARELATKRGLPFDFGLLGDTLMEQGKLKEAVEFYQKMVDLRPDLQSYSRIAHVRWLTGDLEGAMEMMRAAVSASSPRDPDTAAWVNSRLAGLELQFGDKEKALRCFDAALEFQPDYPPALLLRGKLLLTKDDLEAAVTDLQLAATQNPIPEYQWTLADVLREAGRETEAVEIESRIRTQGATTDPRGLSLFLATRGENVELAVQLAEQEFTQREDVFTHDALAWALAAAGRLEEAQVHMEQALAEGTKDPRLFFHASVIASKAGQSEKAMKWFIATAAMNDLLLPSERELLFKLPHSFASNLADDSAALPPSETATLSPSDN